MGAAVYVVLTTCGLRKWATSPSSRRQETAGVAIWAAHFSITFYLLHCFCRQLDKKARGAPVFGEAFTLLQVTHSVLGAAMHVVRATDGIWQWAAAIRSTGQLAAGGAIRALGTAVWAKPVGGHGHILFLLNLFSRVFLYG